MSWVRIPPNPLEFRLNPKSISVRIREVRIIDAADTYTQKEEEGNSRPFNTAGRINSVIQRST